MPPAQHRRDAVQCNKCFTPHPTRVALPPTMQDKRLDNAFGLDTGRRYGTSGGGKRTGEAGGFKEFDDAEDDRRKRRATEERAIVAERKAEKKKCEFCKRASCIC